MRVPSLVGLNVADARRLGHEAGLVVVSDDPDGVPLGERTWPGVWFVTAQVPPAGTWCAPGDVVTVSFEQRGGGAPVREPRRPSGPLPADVIRLPMEGEADVSYEEMMRSMVEDQVDAEPSLRLPGRARSTIAS
ncbi:MAG: PASTA domain-containing protein [Acidimicrobiales bacterium]